MADSLLGDDIPRAAPKEERTVEPSIVEELGAKLARSEHKLAKINEQISQAIAGMQEEQAKAAKRNAEIRAAIKLAMAKNNVSKYDDQYLTITYVKPTTRKGVDVKALAAENPELYKKYEKTTNVSDSIRIKVKEQ